MLPARGSIREVARPSALADEVYNAILDRITCLDIPPGAKISVADLAREIRVSQTPIREALGRLEAQGLVLKTHLLGHRAAPQLDRRQVEHLFELRLLIEPPGAAMAAAKIADHELKALRQLHDDMVALTDKPFHAYAEFARKDGEFHAIVAGGSGNTFLAEALSRLHTHIHIFRLVYHTRVTTEAIEEHASILSALADRKPEKAEEKMRYHILSSRSRILSLLPE